MRIGASFLFLFLAFCGNAVIYFSPTGAISLSKRLLAGVRSANPDGLPFSKQKNGGRADLISRTLSRTSGIYDLHTVNGRSFFMPKSKFTVQRMAVSAAIAAVYAGLTLLLPVPQYGGVQLRVAEAMTLLPFLFPAAIPGLAVGCFLANLLGSPFMLDWIFGTLATLLAALWTARVKHRWLAPVPPVLCNALIVGAEIAYFSTLEGGAFWPAFTLNACTVGLGEFLACFALGLPLLSALERSPALRKYMGSARE